MLNRVPGTQSRENLLKKIRAEPQSMTEKCHMVRWLNYQQQQLRKLGITMFAT